MRRVIHIVAVATLLLAVGAPAEAGGGGCHAPTTTGATTTVTLEWNCFGPTVTNVATGDTVTFINADEWTHTVTGNGVAWGSTNPIAPEGTLTARFSSPGVYPYVCLLHPGMLGAVVVDGAAPAAAVAPGPGPGDDAAVTTLASASLPTALASPSPTGVSWAFALGLAVLAAAVGAAAGVGVPRRRQVIEN